MERPRLVIDAIRKVVVDVRAANRLLTIVPKPQNGSWSIAQVRILDFGRNDGEVEPHCLHFTPALASSLNAIAGFFAYLTQRRPQRGVFRSLVDL